jgi:serine protease Do
MFQITAAVNSGNSGGPVYDSKGEVIGIVSAKYKDIGVEGLGFAIPINDAVQIAEQLITNGYVTDKAFLGIVPQTISSETAEFYNVVEGVWVKSVEPGSCAEKAGLKIGDIITKLGDADVTSEDTLRLAKRKYKAGDTTELVIFRAGEMLTLTVTFDKEPEPELQQQETPLEPWQGSGSFGQFSPFLPSQNTTS